MIEVKRYQNNPIFTPRQNSWETEAVFNGCVVSKKDSFYLVYRAISPARSEEGLSFPLSTIGYSLSPDGVHFGQGKLLIKPEYEWEKFGCEDPRVTKLNNKYFIFYTALAAYPPTPPGIKIGVASSQDLKKIDEKHQVTHFNSKAMALFPEKIKGKMVAVLTVDTDQPPAKIALAIFDKEEQIWSKEYWDKWLFSLNNHLIPLRREENDQIEVGAPPVKTEKGWLLVYSYIRNYLSPPKTFGIEAVLLDLKNPLKIIGRTEAPLLVPEEDYELYGKVPNIVFPSGALIKDGQLRIYYGAADTTCCLATLKLKLLLAEMLSSEPIGVREAKDGGVRLRRYEGNPIIQPNPKHAWESKLTFNPGVIYEGGKVHIVYRAMNKEDTSVLGYASSRDGIHIDERLGEPIYAPREDFEKKLVPASSGCEDPRLTKIGGQLLYMCYTAFDGRNPWRVALTSIKLTDFLEHRWFWEKPILISPPGVEDKDACLLPEKVRNQYLIFHRIEPCIWVDLVDDLSFGKDKWVRGKILMQPRTNQWDSLKIGIGAPPIKTVDGWLLIYHGVSRQDNQYRLGAALLDLEEPSQLKARLTYPLLEPEVDYENEGLRPGTVFTCGAVVMKNQLLVYYGAADQVVCVALADLNELLKELKK